MKHFKQLRIWQLGIDISLSCFKLTSHFPTDERFSLGNQIRRSAYSIPSNFAEGSSRNSQKDQSRFIDISIGSSFELETQLILSFNLKYINEVEYNNMRLLIVEEQKMIYGFTNSLSNNINN